MCIHIHALIPTMPSQADERLVSGEGFMLNLLSVMQLLSEKIKLDKIDFLYPNHPKSRMRIADDTRFKSSSQQVTEWVQKLCKWESTTIAPSSNSSCTRCVQCN